MAVFLYVFYFDIVKFDNMQLQVILDGLSLCAEHVENKGTMFLYRYKL